MKKPKINFSDKELNIINGALMVFKMILENQGDTDISEISELKSKLDNFINVELNQYYKDKNR